MGARVGRGAEVGLWPWTRRRRGAAIRPPRFPLSADSSGPEPKLESREPWKREGAHCRGIQKGPMGSPLPWPRDDGWVAPDCGGSGSEGHAKAGPVRKDLYAKDSAIAYVIALAKSRFR